ncbi:HU family DNA-binding protein [Runella slithyformis]|uniref:Histone family protein DNA-binding protein n=1 Tax=Runella slithyformis (strain ATCC 29530 / DSM 19594 / LMG 11500 / NCIMB 11436 / LSU 4) TaxID=761193 RepID=A0A7U4E6J4_RUNSL|nr:HU family DNA-binding protein [Runella slithyformis]AEI49661.1 histone family protein DNA-binding protein [Runella slithyformis DSM 19594]
MTKAELVFAISRKTGLEKPDVEVTVEALFDVIKKSLANGKIIYLRGFGNFQNKKRARRTARNIKHNTTVIVEAHEYPSFKPSKLFIEELKG